MSSRYDGKPLLRLLELYVIWAIGELGEQEVATLGRMTPQLQQIYRRQGSWHEVIAAEMDFPENMVQRIIELWEKNRSLAERNGESLEPEHFAQMFVDQNLGEGKGDITDY